ncbi:MAG: hypothetical protein KDJ33_04305 [Gammaproteobacteria bacterium]|nr:hypothetical protein [Gammaproteobacteria bacterium]
MRTDWGPMLLLVVAIAAGPAVLLLWAVVYRLGCWSLFVPIGVAGVLTLFIRERLLWRRRCRADCLFEQDSTWHRLLRGRLFATVYAVALAGVLSGALASAVPTWDFTTLVVVAFDALLLVVLFLGALHLGGTVLKVRERHRRLFARHWAVAVNVFLLLGILLWMQLDRPPPDYLDDGLALGPTLQTASAGVAAVCPIVDTLVRMRVEAEAASWWVAIKASPLVEDHGLRWIAWLAFLVGDALSLWGYGTLCAGLIDAAHRRLTRDDTEHA